MKNRTLFHWMIALVVLGTLGGMSLRLGAPSHTAQAHRLLEPDTPFAAQAPGAVGTPTSITKDADGYTLWTYDYSDTWCVMFSRIRWPFDLDTHDPSDLSDASLRLTFAEGQYLIGPKGEPLYTDASWALALNGKPGPWTDGTFSGDWNVIGAIGTTPTRGYRVLVQQEVPFDYQELIDGENNLWFQQQDFCDCAGLPDCACTCYDLKQLQLRAMVKLGIKEVSPVHDTRNVRPEQRSDSEIRVRFSTLVSETTVNRNTFQVYYLDNEHQPVYVDGEPRKLSDTEYRFEPTEILRDGIRYYVHVWGKTDAQAEQHDTWVKDLAGGPMETGKQWSFWTLPKLDVRLEAVQVLEDETLVLNKSTALRVFLSSGSFYTDVWYLDLWEYVDVKDIELTWRSTSGSHQETVSWRAGGNWHFAYTPETARRYRLNDKAHRLASQDSVNYYGFVPQETGTYWLRAAVTTLDSRGEEQPPAVGLITPNAVQTRRITLHVRAMAVGADYGKTGTVNLSTIVEGQRSGMLALYPAPGVSLAQTPSAIPYYAPVGASVWSSSPADDGQLLKALLELTTMCAATSGCDLMAGYSPGAWLGQVGLTSPRQAWYGMLIQEDGYSDAFRYAVAHEAGHLYSFTEHDMLKGGQGYDVRRRTDRRISTALMGPHTSKTLNTINSFMNIDPVESPPPERLWIEWQKYGSLRTRFTVASQAAQQSMQVADPLLLATGLITPASGAVELDPWYLLDPGEWETPAPGPYRLVFLDGEGQEIAGYTHTFTVATTIQPAGVAGWDIPPDAPAPFALKVPFPAATARIEIRRVSDEALLSERLLSASAPGITITPPLSDTWSGPQPITWETDPGETRHFIVQTSTDNGATWEAQAIHLPGTAYTVETASLPNTTGAIVRVIATDGLNSSSDSAEPFTIDNPACATYVSPAPDATLVGVDEPLYVGFGDAMDATTIHSSTLTLSGPGGTIPGTIRYDAETREATFIPGMRLAYSSTYTAHVSNTILTMGGEPLAEAVTWSFTTEEDSSPPRPRLFSPPGGALDVPLNTAVAVTWDRALDAGTLTTASVQVTSLPAAVVGGSVSYDDATQTAVFTPDALLTPRTTYVVTLTGDIADTQGNTTFEPQAWAFTTGDLTATLAFGGGYADEGVDSDGDGLYEALRLRVGVQVPEMGSYALHGTLADGEGNAITSAYSETTLSAGAHILKLRFDGTAIGGHGADGPYTLTGLLLARIDGDAVPATASQRDAYRTLAYPVERFPAPLYFGGLPDVLVTPGTTTLSAFNVRDYAQHITRTSDQLSYTIMLNSNPNMGVALQPSGALLISPEPYWEGSTRVTLQASDGSTAAQASFEIAIGWPQALYLPLVLRSADDGEGRSAWITLLDEDFESETLGWTRYAWIGLPPDGPGGWYAWDRRDCVAYSGQYSAWPYGGGEDGELLACGAAYPDTLGSMMYKPTPLDLTYVARGEYSAKVWTELEAGDEVCLKVAVIGTNSCQGDYSPLGDYYGTCRSGQTNGWEDLTLDLADVPVLGSVLGEEHVCVAVTFQADDSGTRPNGAFVDDAHLRICPEGMTGYCPASLTTAPPQTRTPAPGAIGEYAEDVGEAALAIDGDGRVHVIWDGKRNPNFDDFIYYSSSADGVTWTPYQILNTWSGREPQIALDDVHGRVHLAYASPCDGILHRTVSGGDLSAQTFVQAPRPYYLPGFPLPSGGVAWPSLAVAEDTGDAHLVWREVHYVRSGDTFPVRYRTWYASWDGDAAADGAWSAPLRKVNDQDTFYSSIAAAPDGQAMMAWFQRWEQSSGGGFHEGETLVARTAYGDEPDSFPLRQATHALYPAPERDESILLTYAAGDGSFVLASTHFMLPGYSLAYRYVWKSGAWTGPLTVTQNTAGWGVPVHVGAAADSPLIRYVYSEDGILKTRTEIDGVLSVPQTIDDYMDARGYSGTPVGYFTDAAGDLHLAIVGEKDGVAGFYYVGP